VRGKAIPEDHSVRIKQNFAFFEERIAALKNGVADLCRGLQKLMIVDVSLTRGEDNPQMIFESMNSTGRELSQADLIRNYVLMGLESSLQTQMYEDHWRPMEVRFGQEAYSSYFDAFMRHYLTVKTGEIPNVNAVYDAFKKHSQKREVEAAGVDALLADVQAFADYFCSIALNQEKDKKLSDAFSDLRELKVDVAYPMLLEMYDDFAKGVIDRDDFVKVLRLVESYVFRRSVCAIPTNSLNKTFATFTRTVSKERYRESVEAAFELLPSYRRYPSDEEFVRELINRDMYNVPRRSYWLRRLENYGRNERVVVEDYTIEHIMPQNENLVPEWRTSLGPDWEKVHTTYLHTIGNLTLTGYNSQYGDKPFAAKRDMTGGFRESPLRLNEVIGTLETWDEASIIARAQRLSDLALRVWVRPQLSEDVVRGYRPQPNPAVKYSLGDHLQLAPGSPTRILFDAFRTAVLDLDPNITEEILKLYIAYKAETNVVDVVPQASRLRISLNMHFPDLYDPRGIATDVTNLGRWGNGDAEVMLSGLEDIPYLVGLVRQSLDLQLSSTETAPA
jgi:predicted transport protein